MKQICVVGVGYVGLVTAACFADLGNRVVALDVDEKRVENLKKGIMPIYEPGLEELVKRNVKAGRLSFTTSYAEALKGAEFAFIAVGTPSGVDGNADLQYVDSAARSIAQNMTAPLIIINKSTVPIGAGDWVADIVKGAQPKPMDFAIPWGVSEATSISTRSAISNPSASIARTVRPSVRDTSSSLHPRPCSDSSTAKAA